MGSAIHSHKMGADGGIGRVKFGVINVCDIRFKYNAIDPFLKEIIPSDEKWIINDNVNLKGSWSMNDYST